MNYRTAAVLMLGCLMVVLAGFARAQEPPKVVLLENSDDADRLDYPLLISNKRGYRIRCKSQADEESVIRGLGFISAPAERLTALDRTIIEAAPADNPLLCPSAKNYVIRVFTFAGESGQEFYLQFPTDFSSTSYPNKVYRPGCTGLVEALKVNLGKAVEADPRPFVGNDIYEIQCLTGGLRPPRPETFADWCTKADLTPPQEIAVKALLDQTPSGATALGDRIACAEAVSFLETIKTLSLAGSRLTELDPVSVLPNLTTLTLSDNQIVDTAPLAKLTKLTFLDLSRNKVSNISALALMTDLLEVDLSTNQIINLRPLSSNRALTRLSLANNKIADVSPLRFLEKLTDLDLSKNQLNANALTPFIGLGALKSLNLANNNIADVSPLHFLRALTDLDLSSNQLNANALTPLLDLGALKRLDLSNNRIESMETIGKFAKTTEIDITGNLVTPAQDYPNRPVTLISPWPAGVAGDTLSRLLGAKLADRLGKPVLIENREGADSIIGTAAAARAAPDGYTLMAAGNTSLATAVTIYRDLPYDPTKDFAPVALTAYLPFVLVVHPSLPVHSVPELIEFAKPNKLLYAAVPGSPSHLFAELFKMKTRTQMVPFLYTRTADALLDVLAGRVKVMFSDPVSVLRLIREEKLRAVGVSSRTRLESAPELPPLAEVGLPGFDAAAWSMIVAPANTPKEIVNRLHAELKSIIASPDIRQQMVEMGLVPVSSPPPEELQRFINVEIDRWRMLVRLAGIPESRDSPLSPPFSLINMQTGKCLTIAGGLSRENNIPALQFNCDSDPSRRWRLVHMGRVFQIENVQTGKCLTMAGGENNVPAVQFDCDSDPSRRWGLVDISGVTGVQIKNLQTGKCLTIAGGLSRENNVPAVQFDCDSDPSRRWGVMRE